MSIRIMSAIWANAEYEGGALLVLLALGDWANDDGLCWPKVSSIAQKARMTERQAHKILKQFREDHILSTEPGGGRGISSRYRLNLETLNCNSVNSDSVKRGSLKSETETLNFATENPELCDSPIRKNHQEPSIEPSAKNGKSKQVINREERDRRTALTNARKRGLRDYEKYPLEPWEENKKVVK